MLRRIGSSSRVVTMRQANRVTELPAAGLRAIDPAPFRLRLERLDAARRATAWAGWCSTAGCGASAARGNVPFAARLARGLRGGFRWDARGQQDEGLVSAGHRRARGRRARLLVLQARRRRAALDRRHRHRPLRPRRARDCPTASRSRPTPAGSPGARTGCTSPTPTRGCGCSTSGASRGAPSPRPAGTGPRARTCASPTPRSTTRPARCWSASTATRPRARGWCAGSSRPAGCWSRRRRARRG